MVHLFGGNDPTTHNKASLDTNQNEESLVDKNRIQQWVDRAIGNVRSTGRTTNNRGPWPSSNATSPIPFSTPNLFADTEDVSLFLNKPYGASSPSSSLLTAIENPNTTQSDFDKAFAAELNQLTFQEREKTWDEIHGVAAIQEETEDFVRSKLIELQQAIFDMPLEKKTCYLEAINDDPESRFYVTSYRFQIQFLRAERFDATLAAKRLVLCCEKRVQFFGRSTLRRPLCLSDLTAEEQRTLKGGAFQVLSQRDRSGRLVVIDTSLCGPKLYTSLYAYYKCFWYIIMSVMEDDEETQKRGIVAIVWWMHHPLRLDQDFDNDLRQETIASLNWLPMRPYSSTHVCIDYNHSTMKQILARFMMAVSPKNMRYGIQLHRGTYTEVLYKLLTYGVPVDTIPVSSSGLVKTKNFGRWIQRQRQKEEYLLSHPNDSMTKERKKKNQPSSNPFDHHPTKTTLTHIGNVTTNPAVAGWFAEDRIDLPSNRDVLLGTGKPLMKHPGNQSFRTVVDSLLQVYDTTPALRDKAEVTWGVVRYIQEKQGGRFLKRDKDSDWWQVVSNQEARDKTGKAFVNQRESRKMKRPGGTSTTTTKEKGSATRGPTITTRMTTSNPLREDSTTGTSDTRSMQLTMTGEAVVWGRNLLQGTTASPRPIITVDRTTGSTNGTSHKRRRYEDGCGGSMSNSCFPSWCGGGGGEETTTTSSTATLSSTSFLDGSK